MTSQVAPIEEFCEHRCELAAYIDGELSPAEEIELEAHLLNCTACAAELNEQKKLLQALNYAMVSEPEIELPADFTRRVVANAESKVSGLRRPQERFKALFVCAVLFLLTILMLGAETKTVFSTFAKFAEQFLAVGIFVWNLIYDIAVGTTVILRSISNHAGFNQSLAIALFFGLFFVFLIFVSRRIARVARP